MEKEFVCVRIVDMKGVDLSLFQFDYDLTWAAIFMNANEAIYARYGSRAAGNAEALVSTDGLEETMRRILEHHKTHADDKAPDRKPLTPEEIPSLAAEMKKNKNMQQCIHCHFIPTYTIQEQINAGTYDRASLWAYPHPETIGLILDLKKSGIVKKVESGSPAAKAGVKAGDRLTTINGTPIFSPADVEWALHNAKEEDELKIGDASVPVKKGWKKTDISWRSSMHSHPPRIGLWAPDIGDTERAKLNIAKDKMALGVKWANPEFLAAKAGVKNGDVVIAVDGKTKKLSNQELEMHLKVDFDVGQTVELTVLRGGKPQKIPIMLK